MSRVVEQPVLFTPWPHQVPSMQARANGVRWLYKIWHRRAGKDISDFISSLAEAHSHPGIYYHCFPELAQGRKAFWDGRDNTGTRYIDYVPKGMLASKPNETEMQLELRTKDPKKTSLYQVVGADRLGWIGSNPRHVTMSEYQDQDPQAWHLLSPILMANKGGASFCLTPRGHNHAYELWNAVQAHPAWFAEKLTVLDTRKPDGTRIVTDEDLDFERNVLKKKEAIIQQEYFCDFEGDQEGSVYGDLLQRARADKRVTAFGIESGYPIIPVFDIGHHDATAVGFYQRVGPWRKLIDYVEASGKTVDYFAEVLKQKRFDCGYKYEYVDGKILCIGPHDLRNKHWGSPHSAEEVARQHGLHFRVLPKMSIEDGIAAGRRVFPYLWIHEHAAKRMLEVFAAYHYEWDPVTQSFSSVPVHDWCFTGDTKILTRYGTQSIMHLPSTGEVLTSCGWKRYTHPRITRRNAPLVAVVFSDGLTVKCTPEHLFLTDSGWKSAASLTSNSQILSSLTPSRSISMGAFIAYGRAIAICREVAEKFIETCGLWPLAPSLAGATSITKTMTRNTMLYQTWNAFQRESICQKPGTGPKVAGQLGTSQRKPKAKLLSGIGLKKGSCGIGDIWNACKPGQNGNVFQRIVLSVKSCFKGLSERAASLKSIARNDAKRLRIARVVPLNQTADVWCLTVPGLEEFSLSNGAIVHNCSHGADQFRYFALSDRDEQTVQPVKMQASAQFDPITEADYEFNPYAIGA